MKTHTGAWHDPSRAHCGAGTMALLVDDPTCRRCAREAGRRFEVAMASEAESTRTTAPDTTS